MASKQILLIEDNPDDEELTILAYERSRIANEMLVARDGREALDMLLGKNGIRPAILPQLVLLDLKLPKVDGMEVLRQLRADPTTRRLPVVILTSSREEDDLMRSYDLGANSYVRKPVDFNSFAEVMQQLQLYWLVINEAPTQAG